MATLNEELTSLLKEKGASLVGFADITSLRYDGYERAVSVAVALPINIVKSISDGPNIEYYETYHSTNALLNEIINAGAEFLRSKGYDAFARTTDVVHYTPEELTTDLPHKSAARLAGLGWIGKCALLVTPEYGSALRLSTIVTNAPIECAQPIDEPRCGNCSECKDSCPGEAVSGEAWRLGSKRSDFFDAAKCQDTAIRLSWERFKKEATICGKCIEVCPHTRRYLSKV